MKFMFLIAVNNSGLISLLVAVGIAVIVYGVLCYLFKVEEVRDMFDKVKNIIKGYIKRFNF